MLDSIEQSSFRVQTGNKSLLFFAIFGCLGSVPIMYEVANLSGNSASAESLVGIGFVLASILVGMKFNAARADTNLAKKLEEFKRRNSITS